MTQQRVRVSTESPSYAVCVVGTEVSIDIYGSIPSGATSFDARGTSGVRVYVVYNPSAVKKPAGASRWTLNSQVEVIVSMDIPSSTVNDSKTKWMWGPDGQGAVLLVNCDRDSPGSKHMDSAYQYVQSYADLQDMSLMILRIQGPSAIFADYKLVLHVSVSDVDKVRVFHANGSGSLAQYEHVLGSDKLSYVVDRPSGQEEETFYVEGLAFPDADFSGLVSFSVTLLEVSDKNAPDTPVFTDTVVFRVAPWIMTPNTLQPLEVFVCSMERDSNPNGDFLEALRALVRKANCKLTVCPEVENRHDRWIQDEMEFGYVEAPHKMFPVVFDSPRDRGLKDFAFKRILGPDFGYVTRVPPYGHVSSLDSFGNLDVSPPVTVQGKTYPLGRILIGSSLPSLSNGNIIDLRPFLALSRTDLDSAVDPSGTACMDKCYSVD
ncbi:unnamed protein product [Caretta caretta]